jgi:Zn-finger nucleic acid-binding protein
MMNISLGTTEVAECQSCDAMWIDRRRFADICEDREHHTTILGMAGMIPEPKPQESFRYVRCPICAEFMLRVNFADYSGVIIDTCRAHGLWFEKNELQRIIAFIRAGGLDVARQRKIVELKSAAKHLESVKEQAARERVERAGSNSPGMLDFAVASAIDSMVDSFFGFGD